MKRNVSEIKDDIQTLKDTIAVTDNAEEKEMLQEGITELEKELAEAEKTEKEKPAPKPKPVKKAIVKKTKPAPKVKPEPEEPEKPKWKTPVEKEKVQKITDTLTLKRVADKDVYELFHADNTAPEVEFEKKGKLWHVQCKTTKKKVFNSLKGAVAHVVKELYKGELKKYMDEKKAIAKTNRLRREKREKAGLPPKLTATETITKAVDKTIDKIDDKADKGKSVSRDVNAVLRSFKEGVKDLKEYKEDIDKKLIRELIAILQNLLGSKRMDEGGKVSDGLSYHTMPSTIEFKEGKTGLVTLYINGYKTHHVAGGGGYDKEGTVLASFINEKNGTKIDGRRGIDHVIEELNKMGYNLTFLERTKNIATYKLNKKMDEGGKVSDTNTDRARAEAKKLRLSDKSVTGGMNGYPEPYLGRFISGFENIDEAEKFANDFGGEVYEAHYKDGWRNVELEGNIYKEFEPSAEDYGDNYHIVENEEELKEEAWSSYDNYKKTDEEIAEMDEEEKEEYFEELEEKKESAKRLIDKCKSVDWVKESVILSGDYEDRFFDIVPNKSMDFYYDTHHYVIGVFIREESDEEMDEGGEVGEKTNKQIITSKRFTDKMADELAKRVISQINDWVLITDYPFSGHDDRYELVLEKIKQHKDISDSDYKINSDGLFMIARERYT